MSIVDSRAVRRRPGARGRRRSLAVVVAAALAGLATGAGETAEIARAGTQVLVVYDAGDPASREVAETYRAVRRVDDTHALALALDEAAGTESIPRGVFEREIVAPLVAWWRACPQEARPAYVVLSRHLPLRVEGRAARDGDEASLDSELVFLPRLAAGDRVSLDGPIPNPLFARAEAPDRAALSALGLCLVTRLDGFTTADALALIARAAAADTADVTDARVVVDLRGGARNTGEKRLIEVATTLDTLGVEVVLDTTTAFVSGATGVVGYASWGSNDVAYVRPPGFGWVPGGIAATFVSSSARTLVAPPAGWQPGRSAQRDRYHGGTPQSLVADLLHDGATGASGYVSEPWLDGCVRPDRLMGYYFAGTSLAMSYFGATPYLSWRGVVFGDPLARAPAGARAGHPRGPRARIRRFRSAERR